MAAATATDIAFEAVSLVAMRYFEAQRQEGRENPRNWCPGAKDISDYAHAANDVNTAISNFNKYSVLDQYTEAMSALLLGLKESEFKRTQWGLKVMRFASLGTTLKIGTVIVKDVLEAIETLVRIHNSAILRRIQVLSGD
jgi:hypothetical protein